MYSMTSICLGYIGQFSPVLNCQSPLECIGFSMDKRKQAASGSLLTLIKVKLWEATSKKKKTLTMDKLRFGLFFFHERFFRIGTECWHFENEYSKSAVYF